MTWSLLDGRGRRKYLTPAEREAFIRAALDSDPHTATFCLTLALTGARISEVLALTVDRVDAGAQVVVLETLKRRKRGVFRAIPVPGLLVEYLCSVHRLSRSDTCDRRGARLWGFSRVTAWRRVKDVMEAAGLPAWIAQPKALRHAFGVGAVQERVALSVVKKWLGHAKLETTAIYADPVGEEERALASLLWTCLPHRLLQPHNGPDG